MTARQHLLMLLALGLGASVLCCATPGMTPHEMSAEQHEVSAQGEEKAAAQHAEQAVMGAVALRASCPSGLLERICWASRWNPTARHLAEAERYRKLAAEHRAASQALKDAEATACEGVPEDEQDQSPFSHVEDIRSVTIDQDAPPTGSPPRTVGATVQFRAVPGLTAEWLQTLVNCHLARNAALGHAVPEMPSCPLVPAGVTATVSSVGNGFAVILRGNTPEAISEIVKRAHALKLEKISLQSSADAENARSP